MESWIVEDPRNLRAFVDQLQVAEDLRRASLHDDVSRYTSNRGPRSGHSAAASGNNLKFWRFGISTFAVACCLLLALTTYFVLNPPIIYSNEGIAATDSQAEPEIVATLSEMRDCRWDDAEEPLVSGHLFTLGSALHLLTGVAQITFESGATSIIEGPAQLTLCSNSIELNRGRVSAVVPKSASGFSVLTPSSEVIDLGTEFGVSVEDNGTSEVHVFSGEVITRSRNSAGTTYGEPIFVTTNNAVQYGPDSDQCNRLVADEGAFAKMLADDGTGQPNLSPPVDAPLSLWLASGNWIADEEQRVSVWRDAQCAENTLPDNALQADPNARPHIVKNAINGHPAVRFDGVDDFLVTTPFHSGDNQTVAFVASILGTGGGSPDRGHMSPDVIDYNGPPQFDSRWYAAPNILQIVAKADEQNRISVYPFVFLGYLDREPESPVFVGNIKTNSDLSKDAKLPHVGEPFVAVYVYDHDANRSEFWINNQLVGQNSAPAPISLTSRKVIGRNGRYSWQFLGDIAEIMIYDQGLSDSEVKTLGSSLANKFNIPLVE
jgi:hypothetical protein